ncbi:MAG: hypothetical protein Q8K65_12160 [Alphaproteobacteria bacterium]|nr:hypothetical protein [Alphaproteobacteria bacterium]
MFVIPAFVNSRPATHRCTLLHPRCTRKPLAQKQKRQGATVQRSKQHPYMCTGAGARMGKQALHALHRCTSLSFSFFSKRKDKKEVQQPCNGGATLGFLNKKLGFYS